MNNNMIISFMTMRKVIGILGVSLAFVVMLGGWLFGNGGVEQSISAYYMTNMRDFFVGTLMIAGAFLLSYHGYDKFDEILTSIAGVSAIGIALFPMEYVAPGNFFNFAMPLTGILHYIMAAVFFASTAVMSIFQFTKGSKDTKTKRMRNLVYYISGGIITVSLILVPIGKIAGFGGPAYVLIMEAIMLLAFGASWFVKGEAILKDK